MLSWRIFKWFLFLQSSIFQVLRDGSTGSSPIFSYLASSMYSSSLSILFNCTLSSAGIMMTSSWQVWPSGLDWLVRSYFRTSGNFTFRFPKQILVYSNNIGQYIKNCVAVSNWSPAAYSCALTYISSGPVWCLHLKG